MAVRHGRITISLPLRRIFSVLQIKLKALHSLMRKISSKDELKYAGLGLQLFKKKEIRVTEATATLFVQVR